VKEAAEKAKNKKAMKFPGIAHDLEGPGISIEFDIFRYILIFLTSFGHKSGTNGEGRPELSLALCRNRGHNH